MLKFYALGSPRLEQSGHDVPLGRRKVLAMLAYLAITGQPQTRDTLLALLWPEYDPSSGRANLRRDLSHLKRTIGGELLIADRNQVRLDLDSELWVDVQQFRSMVAGGQGNGGVVQLAEAVDLYGGDLMAGFSIADAPEFDGWLFFERESLRRELAGALQELLGHHEQRGEFEAAIEYGRRWLALDPLHEPAHQELMKLYAWSGQHAAALRQYRECVRLLNEELGVAPEEQTTALHEAIRLRHLEMPDHIAGRENRGALYQESRTGAVQKTAHNLPVQGTPFLGRQSELATLDEIIANPDMRLVTIVGPGGIGKTRLSLAVAERQLEAGNFPDGVYFVPLAPLESAGTIVSAIAEAIKYRFFGEREPWRQMLDHLGQKRLLLVLDNFEHLLEDGTGRVAELLREAPNVKLLTSSRERLHLSSEAVYRIAGLAYPDAAGETATTDIVTGYGAVELLLHHALLMRPSLEPDETALVEMIRISRMVQGVPLALILAASWLELLSFKEIGDEIANNLDILESETRDLPPRQRSVRATFAYSWKLLSEAEKRGFMKLSVFRGGFTHQAAVQVAGAGLRVLRALAEKSLLVTVPGERYGVHELLRQFAAEKLVEAGREIETRGAHSIYYLQALGDREADLKGQRQVEALEKIESDLENVRAAWYWVLQQRVIIDVADAVESLFLFSYMRSRYREGARLLHMARMALNGRDSSRLLGRIIAREVWLLASYATDRPEFETDLLSSLETAKQHDDVSEMAFSNFALGYYHSKVKTDFGAALSFFETSREQYQMIDDKFYLAWALVRLGYCAAYADEGMERSLRLTHQGLELAQQTGNKLQIAVASGNLGWSAFFSGDYSAIEAYFDQSHSVSAELGDRSGLAHSSTLLGLYHLLLGDLVQAHTLATKGLAMATDIGWQVTKAYATAVLGWESGLNGNYKRAQQLGQDSLTIPSNQGGLLLAHWVLSIAYCGLDQDEAARQQIILALREVDNDGLLVVMTWLLPVVAVLEYRAGQETRAVEMLSLAMNHPLSATGWIERWALPAEIRADSARKLGSEAYQAAWERGKELELKSTVTEFLAAANEGDRAR